MIRRLTLLATALLVATTAAAQTVTIRATDPSTGADVQAVGDATNNALRVSNPQLDIALSALRDALRGASAKTLTDVVAALNALSVTISGTVTVTGPLTDTQLRATPVPVSGTFFQATQPVSGTVAATQSGTWTVQPGNTVNSTAWLVTGTGGTFPVTGTFWQATQPISAASLPLPSLASTSTKQSDGSQKTQVVDGSGNVIGATSNALDINIKSGNPTTITATQATGTNLHVVTDSTSTTAVTQATASSLNATVVQGTATNLKTQAEAYQGGSAVAAGNPLQVTLANGSVPSHAVTNAGTFAVQESGAALTALQTIDNFVSGSRGLVTEDNSSTIATNTGTSATNTTPLTSSSAGGYVRQDSTATIAKESGGNLATLVTSTAAVQGTPGYAVPSKTEMTGAQDPIGNVQQMRANAQGSVSVQSFAAPSLPLPPCNPVRRVNCAPKGF